jgi:hypothetical protein
MFSTSLMRHCWLSMTNGSVFMPCISPLSWLYVLMPVQLFCSFPHAALSAIDPSIVTAQSAAV